MEHWLFGLDGITSRLVHPLRREERRPVVASRPGTLLGPEGTGASLTPHGSHRWCRRRILRAPCPWTPWEQGPGRVLRTGCAGRTLWDTEGGYPREMTLRCTRPGPASRRTASPEASRYVLGVSWGTRRPGRRDRPYLENCTVNASIIIVPSY